MSNLTVAFFRRLLSLAELRISIIFLILGAVIIPYCNVIIPNGGWLATAFLLLCGYLLVRVVIQPLGVRLGDFASSSKIRIGPVIVIALGIGIQVLVAQLSDPQPVSDGRTYLYLAKAFAEGSEYIDEEGRKAFWPPGLPLALAPWLRVIEADKPAIVTFNLVLYIIGALAVKSLGTVLFSARAGLIALVLFTIWPNRLLCAGLVSKETLTTAMLLAGTAICLKALRTKGTPSIILSCIAGMCFGIAALAQPGLLLYVLVTPLIFRHWIGHGAMSYLAKSVLVIASAVICMVPWHLRNCEVFKGEFCGISTNGGSVFYRANNPLATGVYIKEGAVPITHLPELEQNQLGFQLGKSWIRDNPIDFLKLSLRKFTQFFGEDTYGASFAILRATGLSHEVAISELGERRLAIFHLASWVSTAFWMVCLVWASRAIILFRSQVANLSSDRLAPLLYPLLYSVPVFSIFESGSRQHIATHGFVIILAAALLTYKWNDRP